MKRLLQITCAVVVSTLSLSSQTDTTYTQVWARYGATRPSWFSTGTEEENSWKATERGIVYNPLTENVYVSSRAQGEPHVRIIDPLTGADAGELLTIGMTSKDANYGGMYCLNNVTVSKDGQIFACNMTLASGPDVPPAEPGGTPTLKAFRVYRWEWEEGLPEMILDYKEGGYRLGDKITVAGDYTSDAYIYAAPGERSFILRWKITGGVLNPTPEQITLKDVLSAGTSITVAPIPNSENFYVSGKGYMPTIFKPDGTNLTQIKVTSSSTKSRIAGRIAEFNGKLYMCMFEGTQNALVIDITNGGENVTDADTICSTPSLGANTAWGEGAVEFGEINGYLHVFVCAPDNGIACYKLNGLGKRINESVEKFNSMASQWQVSNYPNPASGVFSVRYTLPANVRGKMSIDLVSVTGQEYPMGTFDAVAGEQSHKLNVNHLAPGQYFMRLKNGKDVAISKVIVK